MKKSCELCNREARMYCDSDQASLCWDCDERVHTANFIVAKHSRNLLCHVCQSITQWKASGSKFGPTFSVCNTCFNNEGSRRRNQESQETEIDGDFHGSHDDDEEEDYSDSESDSDSYTDTDSEEEDEEDGENQVVPWTIPTDSHPPPPIATTTSRSSSEIGSFSSTRDKDVSSSAVKRFRNNPFPDSEDEEEGCCSSQVKIRASGAAEEDNVSAGLTTTRRIGRLEGPSPLCQSRERCDSEWQRTRMSRERCDSEWQRTRIMDVGSSMLPRSSARTEPEPNFR